MKVKLSSYRFENYISILIPNLDLAIVTRVLHKLRKELINWHAYIEQKVIQSCA